MFKHYLFLIALLFATSISFAQQKDNFDFGLSLQSVRSGNFSTIGLGLDFFFNRFNVTLTGTSGNVSADGHTFKAGWSDIMLGYQISGSKDVKKGWYLLFGYSAASAEAGNVKVSVSSGLTAGVLYKYKHFYGTMRYNSKSESIGLGVGYAF